MKTTKEQIKSIGLVAECESGRIMMFHLPLLVSSSKAVEREERGGGEKTPRIR